MTEKKQELDIDSLIERINILEEQQAQLERSLTEEIHVGRVADVEFFALLAMEVLRAHVGFGAGAEQVGRLNKIHGHYLIAKLMAQDYVSGNLPAPASGIHLIEIGTVRERLWSQSSTSRLSAMCQLMGLNMVTADIDPINIAAAEGYGHYYQRTSFICDKGEDYLAAWQGRLPPYIYIDAYDYDHGDHSEERQTRYIDLTGASISDEKCWRMHLDCGIQLVEKQAVGGIVVVDDVFFSDELQWYGKGKTLMPFLLDNKYRIIQRTESTVALRKSS